MRGAGALPLFQHPTVLANGEYAPALNLSAPPHMSALSGPVFRVTGVSGTTTLTSSTEILVSGIGQATVTWVENANNLNYLNCSLASVPAAGTYTITVRNGVMTGATTLYVETTPTTMGAIYGTSIIRNANALAMNVTVSDSGVLGGPDLAGTGDVFGFNTAASHYLASDPNTDGAPGIQFDGGSNSYQFEQFVDMIEQQQTQFDVAMIMVAETPISVANSFWEYYSSTTKPQLGYNTNEKPEAKYSSSVTWAVSGTVNVPVVMAMVQPNDGGATQLWVNGSNVAATVASSGAAILNDKQCIFGLLALGTIHEVVWLNNAAAFTQARWDATVQYAATQWWTNRANVSDAGIVDAGSADASFFVSAVHGSFDWDTQCYSSDDAGVQCDAAACTNGASCVGAYCQSKVNAGHGSRSITCCNVTGTCSTVPQTVN
jgi:hypothetical protein